MAMIITILTVESYISKIIKQKFYRNYVIPNETLEFPMQIPKEATIISKIINA